MPLLTVSDVELAYEDRRLLRGVSLSIDEGDRIGLLGVNGTGKSSLLAILAGRKEPDAGTRIVRRDLRIGYLEQDPAVDPEMTIRDGVRAGLEGRGAVLRGLERVHESLADPGLDPAKIESLLERQARLEHDLERLGGHDVEHRIEAMIHDLGLRDPAAKSGSLSGGERRRVALARLLLSGPELILLDEPTNHLDAVVTDWLEDQLLDSDVPVMMVTHDRYFLDRVASRIVELDRGQLYAYEGNYSDYLVSRAERDLVERHLDQVRRNTLRRETAWIRRGPPAQRKKSKARLSQYATLVENTIEGPPAELEFMIPPGPRLGTRVIRLKGVSKRFGDRLVVPPLDLEIGAGERIGIVGPNGAGKSTLLGLCTGRIAPSSGEVLFGETIKIAEIDQQRTELDPAKTVLQEVAGKNDYVLVGDRMVRVETFLEQFLFPGDRKHQSIAKLSGGERNRILLAKLLGKGGNVLVLDEPTNDLDVATLRVLEDAITAFPGTVLVVSHDRWFLDRVATRIVYLDGEGGARVHEGALSLLLERLAGERVLRARAEAEAAAKARAETSRSAAPKPAPARKLTQAERRELDQLPDRITAAEAELESIDRRLGDPEFYRSPRPEQEKLAAARAAAAERVQSLYRRWESLEAVAGS